MLAAPFPPSLNSTVAAVSGSTRTPSCQWCWVSMFGGPPQNQRALTLHLLLLQDKDCHLLPSWDPTMQLGMDQVPGGCSAKTWWQADWWVPASAFPPVHSCRLWPGSTVWLPEGLLCFVESAPVSQGQDRLGLEVDTAGHWEGSRNSVARRKTWRASEWRALGL